MNELRTKTKLAWPPFMHPVRQSVMWVGNVPLYDWQVDILNAAAIPHSRVVASMCNFAGKTSILGVVFILSVMAAFPGAMCYATSGNEEQLKAQLFRMLREIADRFKWKVNLSSMLITMPNESICQCSVKAEAASVEGMHGYDDPRGFYRPCAYFLDESKHIQNEKEQAVRRIDPDFYLAVSTPPTETNAECDWFWRTGINFDDLERTVAKRRRDDPPAPRMNGQWSKRITHIHDPDPYHSFPEQLFTYRNVLTWDDVPHLHTPERERERKNLERFYGKKSPFIRSTLYGLASEGASEYPIFSEDDVELMRRAMHRDGNLKPQHGDTKTAADVSQTGEGDPMLLMVRNGTEVLWIEEKMGLRDTDQAKYIVEFHKKLNLSASCFTIDGGGVGGSVGHMMEDTHNWWGFQYFASNQDPIYDYQYHDRYTEIHYWIKDLLLYGVLALPWCPGILRDMRERQYVIMPGGGDKIKCEDKKQHRKRVGHSPDYLDTLIFLFADFPISTIRRGLPLRAAGDKPGEPGGGLKAHFPGENRQDQTQGRIMPGLREKPSLASIMQKNRPNMAGIFSQT